jgi:hypothetical protein
MARADSQLAAGAVFWVAVLRGPNLLPLAVGLTLRDEDLPGHTAKAALPFETPRMAALNAHVHPDSPPPSSEALFVVLPA